MVPNWVIVKGETVFHFETFDEATAHNTLLGGHLMSKVYYESHYKNKYVTKTSTLSDDRG